MRRVRQVPRDEAPEGIVTAMYDFIFGDRDPVATPGLPNGTSGDWWTTAALVPELLQHSVDGFLFYRSTERQLSPVLRELAQTRVGWARGSRFVFSQHCKASRDNGVSEEKIAAIASWATSDVYEPVERAVLAWVDALVYDGGRASDATFEALAAHLGDVEIMELTYIATMYDMHAVMTKALRLELDDRDDPITEVTGPGIAMSLRPDAPTNP